MALWARAEDRRLHAFNIRAVIATGKGDRLALCGVALPVNLADAVLAWGSPCADCVVAATAELPAAGGPEEPR